jgi:hypothetical protein
MRSTHLAAVPTAEEASPRHLTWVANRPIVRDPVVLRQLALAFGIPLAVLFVVVGVVLWPWDADALLFIGRIVLVTGAIFLVLLLIGVAVVAIGGYRMAYRLDDEGVGGVPHGRTATKNRVVNGLLVLSGRPSAMGAGLLAQSNQAEYTAWRDVDRVETDPRRRTLTLYRGRRRVMTVPCDEAHYEAVVDAARASVAGQR